MCSSVTTHHASVTHEMHQDPLANQNRLRDGMYGAVNIVWGFFIERLKVHDLKKSFYNRKTYHEPLFRLKVVLSALLQTFIFVFQSTGKMLLGPHGVFVCSTSSDHWKKCRRHIRSRDRLSLVSATKPACLSQKSLGAARWPQP